jgi:hypothetical protein
MMPGGRWCSTALRRSSGCTTPWADAPLTDGALISRAAIRSGRVGSGRVVQHLPAGFETGAEGACPVVRNADRAVFPGHCGNVHKRSSRTAVSTGGPVTGSTRLHPVGHQVGAWSAVDRCPRSGRPSNGSCLQERRGLPARYRRCHDADPPRAKEREYRARRAAFASIAACAVPDRAPTARPLDRRRGVGQRDPSMRAMTSDGRVRRALLASCDGQAASRSRLPVPKLYQQALPATPTHR